MAFKTANITGNPGLYIHVPYCDTKCGYCDFYSITNHSTRGEFVGALQKEFSLYARPPFNNACFDTVYFGGGTPSLLESEELYNIFSSLRRHFKFSPQTEITLEVNPGTLTPEKLKAYKELGVNRLSIGIQSFDDDQLRLLNRIHTSEQAVKAVERARSVGIENLSIDLIFALPGQSLESWNDNMRKATSLEVPHISAYNLIFEPGTAFYKQMLAGKLVPQSESNEWRFFKKTMSVFAEAGYEQYEVSNYAQNASLYSRHNCKYWDHTPYLSFGPSAHSFWNNRRWSNVRSAAGYIRKLQQDESPLDFEEQINRETQIFERIMLGLRTRYGVDLKRFREHFKTEPDSYYPDILKTLFDDGFAEIENDFLRLTDKGLMICDEIILRFAPQ